MKKIGPYIGVTGFMSLEDVAACDRAFCGTARRYPEAKNLNLMVGILVSSKTLVGGTNRFPGRYPPIDRIPGIISMAHHGHLLHTIHYNTDDQTTIDEQIDQVISIAPLSIDAIQLNVRWVSPVKMQRVRRKYPNLRIVLQIGAGALADVDEPGEIFLGEALRLYDGLADDFLVDPSGGKGEPVDVWRAFACIADGEIPCDMRPGIAGGFCAENVYKIKGLIRRLRKPVNIDAEGRLRTPMEEGDHLIIEEAQRYIRESIALIGGSIVRYC